jgi:hypothetical protein
MYPAILATTWNGANSSEQRGLESRPDNVEPALRGRFESDPARSSCLAPSLRHGRRDECHQGCVDDNVGEVVARRRVEGTAAGNQLQGAVAV